MAATMKTVSSSVSSWVGQLDSKKSSFLGSTQSLSACTPLQTRRIRGIRGEVTCSVDAPLSRRDAILLGAVTAAGLLIADKPASAAYGQQANVFGKQTPNSGYLPITGDGFALNVPAKWNPSKERDFGAVALRWEDNFDAGSHVVVLKQKTDKSSIDQYGTPEAFAQDNAYLLGEQVWEKNSTEGGFGKNKVQKANFLETAAEKDSAGNTYYKYEILTQTADGTEGGRHVLVTAAVKNGNLYIAKATAGDKRWFKGTERLVRDVASSFRVV
eukprot:TRINITY_DN22268_c0_g1_i1.p1 TRINITY_DN22268_c0_g1~~TRINITY_DN22268_c0_g1_i1.p1  ORF type:complete len:271 (+),score=74.27 TRINITY_DN22268_c0_g1_i1:125-937(+)